MYHVPTNIISIEIERIKIFFFKLIHEPNLSSFLKLIHDWHMEVFLSNFFLHVHGLIFN